MLKKKKSYSINCRGNDPVKTFLIKAPKNEKERKY